MSFIVYLDESGITDPEICVVAGYAATSLQWNIFARRWRTVLRKHGIRDEFHAKVFFSRRQARMVGEYNGWSKSKADSFLQQLVFTLKNIHPILVGTAISVADFFDLTESQRRFITGGSYDVRTGKLRGGAIRTPFHVPMQNTTIQAAKFTPEGTVAHFICDKQKQYGSYVVERFNIIKARNPKLPLGDITQADSRTTPPLQAADLVCYLAFQFAKQRLRIGKKQPSRPFLDLIGHKYRFDYFDEPLLQRLVKGVR